MNDADIDLLSAKIKGEPLIEHRLDSQEWKIRPEIELRQRCIELAIDINRGYTNVDDKVLAAAARFYKFITGDSDANLHGQKQDER